MSKFIEIKNTFCKIIKDGKQEGTGFLVKIPLTSDKSVVILDY